MGMKYSYQPGDRPLDGYTISKPLGHGGFGEVYHAVSEAGKEVALKLILRHLDVELRGVTNCLNLKHTNLVTIYDLRSNPAEEHWIIMEYVEGPTLARLLARHPDGLPRDDVLRWLEGIAAGVGYLHEKALVHRDLKPGNIFLEGETVKVIDYGLSKFITGSRRSGQTQSVGTLHYMAPEIGSGRYGPEIDIYSLGVILYEMLTGDVPFDGETPAEILMKHLSAVPDLSRLPEPFQPVVGRMLAKKPEDRYGSVQDVLADVRQYLSDPALAVTATYRVESSESRVESREQSRVRSQDSRAESPYGETPPPRDVGTLSWLLPSPSTRRRWGESLREHPLLFSLCVLITLLLLIPLVGGITAWVFPAGPEWPSSVMYPWALAAFAIWPSFAALVGVAVCAWGFLWRANSPTKAILARQQEEAARRSAWAAPVPGQQREHSGGQQADPRAVLASVRAPAIGLIVVGILGLVAVIAFMLLSVVVAA
jgi:serine/threonine protein kinase